MEERRDNRRRRSLLVEPLWPPFPRVTPIVSPLIFCNLFPPPRRLFDVVSPFYSGVYTPPLFRERIDITPGRRRFRRLRIAPSFLLPHRGTRSQGESPFSSIFLLFRSPFVFLFYPPSRVEEFSLAGSCRS